MRAFIYDKYGYYPDEEYSTSFEYQGWFFKLEICEKNDTELYSLRLLLNEINQSCFENLYFHEDVSSMLFDGLVYRGVVYLLKERTERNEKI